MARHRLLLTAPLFVLLPMWAGLTVQAGEVTPSSTPATEMAPAVPPDFKPDHRPDGPGPDRKGGKDSKDEKGGKDGHGPEGFRDLRKELEKMAPDERQKAIENLKKMKDLPEGQRDYVKFLNEQRKKRLEKGVNDALEANGLKLDDEQRRKFSNIYLRERWKMEEQLRKEMDQRRQQLLPDVVKSVVEQYQKEAAAPAVSPAPAKVE